MSQAHAREAGDVFRVTLARTLLLRYRDVPAWYRSRIGAVASDFRDGVAEIGKGC